MARLGGAEDQVEGQDEEFVYHLTRGSELLAAGDADGARGALERALELRARDAKVLGLLGQACYRQGRFEDAIVAWQRLVDENPAEPAARVNLGLAFLRARRHAQATRQLEIALDLNPDHKKAMGYLGLALLESGDPAHAREWFVKAGSEQMVARCDRELLGGAAPAGPGPAAAPEPEPEAEADLPVDVDVDAAEDEGGFTSLAAPLPAAAGPQVPAAPAAVAPVVAAAAAAPSRAEGAAGGPAAPTDLAAYADAHALALSEAPFALTRGLLAVRVHGAVRARLTGLVAARGELRAEPEVKHFRGHATETAFGEGADRVHRVEGEGWLLLAPGKRCFTPLRVTEGAFFREEALFALEEPLAFENGRVPSASAGELNLAHVRGQGAVLVRSGGPPRALDVTAGAPLRLPVAALVGWTGTLTPRLGALVEGMPAEEPAVELTGEGRVLVDPGAGPEETP